MSSLNHITRDPPNAGVPLRNLDGRLHRQGDIYQRNNFAPPTEVPEYLDIVMPGRAETRLSLELVRSMKSETLTMVLECAGNGRIFMEPIPSGTPWDLGGVSFIEATAVPISAVLGVIPSEVVDLVFVGADHGSVEPDGEINYEFSIDPTTLTTAGPLLVTAIGGEPLTHEHGGPIRLIVPGQYAMKSVKWLTRIEGHTSEFRGHFVSKYRYYSDSTEPEAAPVDKIAVRSLIAFPAAEEKLERETIEIVGSAWSGHGQIDGVDVKIDDRPWEPAQLNAGHGFAVSRWSQVVTLGSGSHTVSARATDSQGNVQPEFPRWNVNGYANNLVHKVSFQIE